MLPPRRWNIAPATRAWFPENGSLEDIIKNGISAGWPHFTYTKSSCQFYDRFEDEIFEIIDGMDEDRGVRDVLQVLAQHTDLEVHDADDWKEGLAWTAVIEVIGHLLDESERATAAPDDVVEAKVAL